MINLVYYFGLGFYYGFCKIWDWGEDLEKGLEGRKRNGRNIEEDVG